MNFARAFAYRRIFVAVTSRVRLYTCGRSFTSAAPMSPEKNGSSRVARSSSPSPPPATPQASQPSSGSNATAEEDVQTLNFEFEEEPLGLTAEQGYGYLQVEFGEHIGPDDRYRIIRKLGFGMNSSVWLAMDRKDERYVAIKALKGHATSLLSEGYMQELEILQRITSEPLAPGVDSTHCLSLLAHFTHPGKDQDGEHLCFVTDVLGGHVNSLVKTSSTDALPLPLAKRVLRHTLIGLAHLHRCGIAHTDLKGDNIMMDLGGVSMRDLDVIIQADPPRRHPPEPSWGKQVEVAVSQPLPVPSSEEALSRSFRIADFGSAQLCDRQVTNTITPDTLRAPESILKGPWNEKVDIWIFGCLVFEFLTGRCLFNLKNPKSRPEDYHLWLMMCMTGERFMPPQLKQSEASLEFFDTKTCFLKEWPNLRRVKYQTMLSTYKTVGEADMDAAAALMSKCLRLNPENRASAEELLNDPWLAEE